MGKPTLIRGRRGMRGLMGSMTQQTGDLETWGGGRKKKFRSS